MDIRSHLFTREYQSMYGQFRVTAARYLIRLWQICHSLSPYKTIKVLYFAFCAMISPCLTYYLKDRPATRLEDGTPKFFKLIELVTDRCRYHSTTTWQALPIGEAWYPSYITTWANDSRCIPSAWPSLRHIAWYGKTGGIHGRNCKWNYTQTHYISLDRSFRGARACHIYD